MAGLNKRFCVALAGFFLSVSYVEMRDMSFNLKVVAALSFGNFRPSTESTFPCLVYNILHPGMGPLQSLQWRFLFYNSLIPLIKSFALSQFQCRYKKQTTSTSQS